MNVPPGFDEDFGAASDWALEYRKHGIQVVPCANKMPALKTWKQYQGALVSQQVFDAWYGLGGQFVSLADMGMLTGTASDRILMVDLDLYKPGGELALNWWLGILAVHNNAMELETWEQFTGGGGRQLFFRYPSGWSCANAKTDIHVDIRGQGGFAVLPPTRHASGKQYVWEEGRAPWEIPLLEAPAWLLEEIERLVREHGGGASHGPRTAGNGPDPAGQGSFDGFGNQTDGREDKMYRMVWRVVLDWSAACPIKPSDAESAQKARHEYDVYERKTRPQQQHPADMTLTQKLDAEGRGWLAWWSKWQYAMRQWDGKVYEEARKPDRDKDEDLSAQFDSSGNPISIIMTSKQFADGLVAPSYIVDGIIQRGFLYSLTARTHHGKTAVIMRAAAAIARGENFAGCETRQGSVLFFAGENPQDVRARYVAMCDVLRIDTDTFPFYFVDGTLDIDGNLSRIQEEAVAIPDLRLIIVDTAAAYFPGDDGNSNAQLGAYARILRKLTFLPSLPTGIVNCHPIKNAAQDNLLPMGGSAFVNEVDGNLTLWAEGGDKTTILHWQGKFRGPEFDPVSFELKEIHSEKVKDEKGRLMPSIMAVYLPDTVAERRGAVNEEDENIILRLIHADKHASFAALAKRAGFTKSKVQRIITRLKEDKMVRKFRGSKYRVTHKGCVAAGINFEPENDAE